MQPSLPSNEGNYPYSHPPHGPQNGRGYGSGVRYGLHGGGGGLGDRQVDRHLDWADADPTGDDYSPSYSADGRTPDLNNERSYAPVGQIQNSQRPQYARMCKRTLALSGLPENTTHKDVTNVVRGGMLLDIFLRAAEHVALVSFLREEDAVRFYDHARKNDVYIKNKRARTTLACSCWCQLTFL